MGTLPYTQKMVLDFKYSSVLVFITCIFTMPAALLYGMRELFTFVACQMLNFVYKLAIRVYIQNNSIKQMLSLNFSSTFN